MCADLQRSGVTTFCAEGIIEKDLELTVCAADVIFVLPYYPNSSLATHRIDPLILAGKPVVTIHSNDPDLDSVYADVVKFVSPEEIVASVGEIVREKEKEREERGRGKKELEVRTEYGLSQNFSTFLTDWMTRKIDDIQPLCFALSSLSSHFPSP